MPFSHLHQIGILPSLEVLPFFEQELQAKADTAFVPRSSYGGIAREMLTGVLDGGILPWEIFTTDVLARPGQRTNWSIPAFIHACPTELVLQPSVHRALHQSKSSAKSKLPGRLIIGVESRNSLTKNQVHEWLAGLLKSPQPKITFKFLPIDLMPQAMAADAIDGFIAATPWGIVAEEKQLGILDRTFIPGTFAQKVVIACRRSDPARGLPAMTNRVEEIQAARARLANTASFLKAVEKLTLGGSPVISVDSLTHAALQHASTDAPCDLIPDLPILFEELRRLETFSVLPVEIAANEQTAQLLLPL